MERCPAADVDNREYKTERHPKQEWSRPGTVTLSGVICPFLQHIGSIFYQLLDQRCFVVPSENRDSSTVAMPVMPTLWCWNNDWNGTILHKDGATPDPLLHVDPFPLHIQLSAWNCDPYRCSPATITSSLNY